MKAFLLLIACAALLSGCATSSIESRKQERYGAFSSLSDEHRALVDKGQIKVGMPMDAVYIAWGEPSQVLSGEAGQVQWVTWLYHGTYLESYRYWTYRGYPHGPHGYYSSPYLETDYYPRGYVQAEVQFENGLVKHWRSLPAPPE